MAHSPSTLAIAALCLLTGCYQGVLAGAGDEGSSGSGPGGASEGGTSSGEDTGDAVPHEVVPEPLHRLNRLEYNNTVRDLLGTSLTPADSFPPDNVTLGFDNVAEGLTPPAGAPRRHTTIPASRATSLPAASRGARWAAIFAASTISSDGAPSRIMRPMTFAAASPEPGSCFASARALTRSTGASAVARASRRAPSEVELRYWNRTERSSDIRASGGGVG